MTIEFTLHNPPKLPEGRVSSGPGRPPRVACLLALAHRFDELVRSGVVKDYAELARLSHVTRARISQIMNLLNLAPEIQEYLLWLPDQSARPITERDVRRVAREVRWDRQQTLFRTIRKAAEEPSAAQGTAQPTNQGLVE